jgi:ParB-like nuclease domain.
MTDDFQFGLNPEPADINQMLREKNIDPRNLVWRKTLNINDLKPLTGYVGEADYSRAWRISERYDRLMPILVVAKRIGDHQVINGMHRLRAAQMRGQDTIEALVVPPVALDLIYHPYGAEAMHKWAHDVANTSFNP